LQLRHAESEFACRSERTLEQDRGGLAVTHARHEVSLEQGEFGVEKRVLTRHLDRLVDRAEPVCRTACQCERPGARGED
jgi:hypothetical protein